MLFRSEIFKARELKSANESFKCAVVETQCRSPMLKVACVIQKFTRGLITWYFQQVSVTPSPLLTRNKTDIACDYYIYTHISTTTFYSTHEYLKDIFVECATKICIYLTLFSISNAYNHATPTLLSLTNPYSL